MCEEIREAVVEYYQWFDSCISCEVDLELDFFTFWNGMGYFNSVFSVSASFCFSYIW